MNTLYDFRHKYEDLDELEFVFEQYRNGFLRYTAASVSLSHVQFILDVFPRAATDGSVVLRENEDLESISKQVSMFRLRLIDNGDDVDTGWLDN